MTPLVIGADVGGTSTRVAVADLDGRVLAVAVGGPGNPNSVGVAGSAAQIRTVVEQALAGLPPAAAGGVRAVVLGLAGGSRVAAEPDFLRAAVPDRLNRPAVVVSDLSVAFCSATSARRGSVLVAGTGAVAGQVVDAGVVRQGDGWGWLLGDEGSGFWLGRAAVRATLDAQQRGVSLGPMHRAVQSVTGTSGYLDLLQACYGQTPSWLAGLAPLVSEHAATDPVAGGIAVGAVDRLEQLLLGVDPRPEHPLVLAGSVVSAAGPVGRGLRDRLRARGLGPVLSSSTGVVGALWIALRPYVRDAAAVHARLLTTAGSPVRP